MSERTPEDFQGYGRRCLTVFGVVMCITLMMVGVFYAHLPSPALSLALILAAAVVNAALVAGYLMHIVTEQKLTLIVLLFTAIFFVGLFALTLGARHSVPWGTVH
jgi:heme/copper-type cytochrome/quinol oxidase subunit 4